VATGSGIIPADKCCRVSPLNKKGKKMQNVYLVSTMTDTVRYRQYQIIENMPSKVFEVSVRGGAGLPTTKSAGWGEMSYSDSGSPIWTPEGFVTKLTAEQYEILKTIPVFQKHLENGFVQILDKDPASHEKVEKITRDMKKRDGASQITGSEDPRILNKKIKISTGDPAEE
jgi:hypothetical protein